MNPLLKATVFSAAVAFPLFAWEGRILGGSNNKPIEGAQVRLGPNSMPLLVMSDAEGRFYLESSIPGAPSKLQTVSISLEGEWLRTRGLPNQPGFRLEKLDLQGRSIVLSGRLSTVGGTNAFRLPRSLIHQRHGFLRIRSGAARYTFRLPLGHGENFAQESIGKEEESPKEQLELRVSAPGMIPLYFADASKAPAELHLYPIPVSGAPAKESLSMSTLALENQSLMFRMRRGRF